MQLHRVVLIRKREILFLHLMLYLTTLHHCNV